MFDVLLGRLQDWGWAMMSRLGESLPTMPPAVVSLSILQVLILVALWVRLERVAAVVEGLRVTLYGRGDGS